MPELDPVFRAAGTQWRYRHIKRGRHFGSYYVDQVRFGYYLFRERIDIIHALHSFVPLCSPCPVVATVYDCMEDLFEEYSYVRRSRAHRIYNWALRKRVTRLVSISEATKNDVRGLLDIDPLRIDVTPLGTGVSADSTPTSTPSIFRSLSGVPILASPYNLEPRKNLDTFLEAVAGLRESFPDLAIVLFGRAAVTPERERLFESRVRELELEDAIMRTGILSDSDLCWLYRHCTIFVFPSLYEGFGLPVLEAMACGACVVARDASAMAEVVSNAGFLVETRNSQAFSRGLSMLLHDPDLQLRLRRAGVKRSGDFTLENMARLTYSTYMKAMGFHQLPNEQIVITKDAL